MLEDLIASLRPREYRRFAQEKGSRAAAYIAFLAILFTGALAVSVKLRLAPAFDETFSWLEKSMPTLRLDSGRVTSDAKGPVRLQNPRDKDLALMIDTGRAAPVTPKTLEDAGVSAYLTSNALYLPGAEPGRLQVLDLSQSSGTAAVVLDAAFYRGMRRSFNRGFYPAILLVGFLFFAASLALFGVLYALAARPMVPRAAGARPAFGALFRVAVHAQTPAALLRALDQLLPVSIPYGGLISLAASLIMLWLGVRAAYAPDA